MRGQQLGAAALTGWREQVAKGVARPVARRAPTDEAVVEQLVGLAFFALAVVYVVRTVARWARSDRRR